MKIALVHDYLNEFGGAERVLKTLTEIYPEAPIYTAFRVKGSAADSKFEGKIVVESWLSPLLKTWRLYSPLRFLTPVIWKSFNLKDYDLVITSASWYVTRGMRVSKDTKVVCYCHTPPRWLYGYDTSIEFQKHFIFRVYAKIVGSFIRMYDKWTVKTVDVWIANSKNVQGRIKEFYGQDSVVIYPPVNSEEIIAEVNKNAVKKENYYLIVSRLVGAKGIETALKVFENRKNTKLKIVGAKAGLSSIENKLKSKGNNIELLGCQDDEDLYQTYAKAKGFIALAKDEDFGMTVVEAMAAGTPVLAYKGGGFKESVVGGKTGVFIDSLDKKSIEDGIRKMERIKWNKEDLQKQAIKFGKRRFIANFLLLMEKMS